MSVDKSEAGVGTQHQDITTVGQAWIAKGLSGALNLVVPADAAVLRFDFAFVADSTVACGSHPCALGEPQNPAAAARHLTEVGDTRCSRESSGRRHVSHRDLGPGRRAVSPGLTDVKGHQPLVGTHLGRRAD